MMVPSLTPSRRRAQQQRQKGGAHCHRHIKQNLCNPKFFFRHGRNSPYKRLPRQHNYIGQHFQIHTEAENQTPYQQSKNFCRIGRRMDKMEQLHGQINKISK